MPKVSVVMPAYNAEKYIGEAIDSILNQTFTDFEFIIINDGSTDRTEEIIQSYSDSRIVYLRNEQNRGISDTLNRGLDTANGEYIARMDSDDISLSERLSKQVKYMDKHLEIGVLGVATIEFGEGIKKEEKQYCISDPKDAKAGLFFSTCLAHPTVMIRASVLNKNKLRYESAYDGMEDYLLWWKIAHYTELCVLDEALFKYRIHQKQVTQNVNAEVIRKIKNFEELRLREFGIVPTERERDLFYAYCSGHFGIFDEKSILELMAFFERLTKLNKEKNNYPQKAFSHMLGLAVMYTISSSNLCEAKKKQIRRIAVKRGVISPMMCLKLIYHGAIL